MNKNIRCQKCGSCCHVDMIAYVTNEDKDRWGKEKRYDILSRIERPDLLWAGDMIVSTAGKRLKCCVFLDCNGNNFFCNIYETRPLACRNYAPGSSELCPLYNTD